MPSAVPTQTAQREQKLLGNDSWHCNSPDWLSEYCEELQWARDSLTKGVGTKISLEDIKAYPWERREWKSNTDGLCRLSIWTVTEYREGRMWDQSLCVHRTGAGCFSGWTGWQSTFQLSKWRHLFAGIKRRGKWGKGPNSPPYAMSKWYFAVVRAFYLPQTDDVVSHCWRLQKFNIDAQSPLVWQNFVVMYGSVKQSSELLFLIAHRHGSLRGLRRKTK